MSINTKTSTLTPIVGTIDGTHLKVYNWHNHWFPVGPGNSTRILDEFQHNKDMIRQNVLIITGPPGEGKTYYAMRLAQILDDKFNPVIQVVFDRSQLIYLIGPNSPLRMGQVILVDEAQFAMSARAWFESLQKDLMQHMEAIRSSGLIIIVVALHISLIDKVIRKHIFSYKIDMKDRGIAIVYRMRMPPFEEDVRYTRIGTMQLLLPDAEYCSHPNCLKCKWLNCCMTNRAVYERAKKLFLGQKNLETQAKDSTRQNKRLNFDELIAKVRSYKADLQFTKQGKVTPVSISLILERKYHGTVLPKSAINEIIARGEHDFPEIFSHQIIKEKKTK